MKNNFRTLLIAVLCMAMIAGMIITSQAVESLTVPTDLGNTEYRFQVTDATFDNSGNATVTVRLLWNEVFTPGSVTINIGYPADSGLTAANFTTPPTTQGFTRRLTDTPNLIKDVMSLTDFLGNRTTVGNTSYFDFAYTVSGYDTTKGDLDLSFTSDLNVIGLYNGEETEPTPINTENITISVPGAPQTKPTITNSATLTPAVVGEPYTGKLEPDGTYTPKTSPNGLSIDAQGNITGTPTAAGNVVFEDVIVTVDGTPSDPTDITIPVNAAANPATLLGSNPPITKVIDGTGASSKGFNFTLAAIGGVPMPDKSAFTITTATVGTDTSLDFRTAEYSQPGKYYYELKETQETTANFRYDDTTYYIEVTVVLEGENKVVKAVVASTEMNNDKTALQGPKVTGLVFTNIYNNPESTTAILSLSKNVTGDMANTEKNFTFTVNLTDASNAPLGGSFPYSGSKTGSITNGGTIELKHGQEITIRNLPKGSKYQIVETSASGYTQAYSINGATQQTGGTASGTLDANGTVAFVNDASYAPPTGINMNGMLPFAGMAIVCLGAAALLIAKKRGFAK